MVKRPERVRVLGRRYTVQYVLSAPLDEDDLGECDSNTHTISIRDKQNLQAEQTAFLHEVLEAINEEMKVHLKHDQIEQLEVALMQFVQENPSALSYLRKRK